MRLLHPAPALAALLTAGLVLSGCSGDDSDNAEPETTATAEAGFDEETGVTNDGSGDQQRDCKVKIDLTGAVETSMKGKGESVQPANGEPAAYYTFSGKKGSMQVFAGSGDIPTSAVVTVDGTAYTTPPDDPAGVEASEDGTSVSVDAAANPTDGGPVDIVAEFTCGKG